jgi:hypothetical protein
LSRPPFCKHWILQKKNGQKKYVKCYYLEKAQF